MVSDTLEVAWRSIQINIMKNRLRIQIFLTATRRVYCVGMRLSLPLWQSDPGALATRTDSHPGAFAQSGVRRAERRHALHPRAGEERDLDGRDSDGRADWRHMSTRSSEREASRRSRPTEGSSSHRERARVSATVMGPR